jgi:hypothetical protein
MQKNIQNTIEKVSNSFPSLFSKEDVIKLLTDLNSEMQEESPKLQVDLDILATTFREVLSEKNWDHAVDSDDVEFSLSYDNRVEVDRIPVDEDFIIDEAVNALEACWNVLKDLAEEN